MASDSSSQDNSQYSVDEMMANLKRGDRQKQRRSSGREGELVTREDGTQVVKVKRRKRRSKQPEKPKKQTLSPKAKWVLLGSIIGVLLLIVVAIIFIIAKYNGRTFTESTEAKIAEISGASETAVTQLRVTPVSAKAGKFELSWDRHSFLNQATLNNLRADIKATSFFGSDWVGEEVVASTGKVYFQTPVSLAETSHDPVPSPYQFGSYRCNELDIHFGDERDAPSIIALQMSQRKMENERYQFVFQDGLIQVPNWPELTLASGVITLNSQYAEIETLLGTTGHTTTGQLSISGRISRAMNKAVSLDINAKDYPIHDLLGKELGRIIQGTCTSSTGTLSYDYQKSSVAGLSFVLPFSSTDIQLTELPMLAALKDLTGNTDYVRPIFRNSRGTITRTSEGVSINDIAWISSSLLTIRGNLHMGDDKKLSGTLDIGVPSTAFHSDPPAPFEGPKDGLYHATVTISGTIHNPYDNLGEQIKAAGGNSAMPKTIPSTPIDPQKALEDDFDSLSR